MLLLILLPLLSGSGAAAQPVWDPLNPAATDWLTRFGYLPPPDAVRGQLQMQEALTEAIKAMQRFAGLEISGVIDEATLSLMKTPRCSLPDVTDWDTGSRKRAVHPGTKWNKRNLSWRVRTFPRDPQLGHDTIRALMYYGLKVWSDVAPLNFHEVAGDNADILIDFSKAQHQDPYPFDGPGGAVAHAFFPGDRPGAGGVHFDDDEAWSFRSADEQVMDLFAVAVHEFGHAIGLPHSSSNVSIMRPYYQGPVGDPLQYHLPHHDQLSIWQMYGVRELLFPTSQTQTESSTDHPVLPAASPRPRPTAPVRADLPDRCNTDFDAVAQIRGEAFFFKGKYFWRLTRDRHLVSLQPAEIQRFWRGLPPNMGSVDSVYERTTDHKIVFFKGDRYWVFKDNNVEEGYPRFIADFGLSVTSVDVAFVSPHNDTTYLFKDNQYWRYDDHWRKMDPAYPKTTALWKGLPSGVDDAMRWSDGATYFFKGKEYWKVLGSNMEVDQSSPQPVGRDWLSCSQMQADSSIGEHAESRPRSAPHPGHETGTGGERRNCTCGSGAVTARPAMRLMHEAILPLILLLALPLCLGTV